MEILSQRLQKSHCTDLKTLEIIMLTLTSMLSLIISKSKGIIMLLYLVEYLEEHPKKM